IQISSCGRVTVGDFLGDLKRSQYARGTSVVCSTKALGPTKPRIFFLSRKNDLNLLKSFLKDANAKKQTSEVVKNCVDMIKEIIYDAKDIIETRTRKRWWHQEAYQKTCLHYSRTQGNHIRIESLSKRISKVICDMEKFGVQKIIADVRDPQPSQQRVEFARKPNEEENKILGMTKATLQDQLFQLLETFKSLIVFDDIWKEEDWKLIKPIFPHNKGLLRSYGSKVLLTSRNERVAARGETYINFRPDFLSDEDSWTLFQRIERWLVKLHLDDEKMEEMGKKMIKHCQRLPLAIRVLGDELVRRSMVISERDNATSRFEKCYLHDLMRELCMSKAKEENFLSPSAHPQSLSVSQRFFTHDPYTLDVEREINNSKVRSLVVVQKVVLPNSWMFARNWKLSSIIFTRLQLLRILHVYKAEFEGRKLPDSIGKLIHLRYLNIEAAGVSHLPASLRNLKLLIYLNLNVNNSFTFVPNVLMEMIGLRNYEYEDKVGIESASKVGDVGEFFNSGLGRLENLTVDYYGAKGRQEWIILDFNNLRELSLSIKIMLSAQLQFPSRITRLSLEFCSLVEDLMPVLEKLSQLKFVTLGSHSFLGRRMVCSAGGFPQLQKLELFGLVELEEWIIEEGSMPLLHTLQIDGCKKLNKLPDGLQLITSLKKLTLRVNV
ncbi:hypothetical protein HID58_042989, partial [Brassica napus]